jgi:rhomboid protease GluP
MKLNFPEIIKNKSDKELEQISKDHTFYSGEERLLALSELEIRNKLNAKTTEIKKTLFDSIHGTDEDLEPKHRILFKDLVPHINYLFTPILLYFNILIFIVMAFTRVGIFEPDVKSLLQWGGNIRFLTLNGQYWRLLSSMFLHAGLIHLACNMFALLYVGVVLEPSIGKYKYLFAYIFTGLSASVSSLIINENVVSVGASGAIFGLFGLLIALLLCKEFKIKDLSKKSLLLSIGFFVFYNLLNGFSKTGIDNAAHIGGLISGFLIGLSYYLIIKGKLRAFQVLPILLIVFSSIFIFSLNNITNIYGEYDIAIKQFSINEQKALSIFREDITNISEENRDLYKSKITESIRIWHENVIMLEKLQKHNYPSDLNSQLKLLIEYSQLREKSCEIVLSLLNDESENLKLQLTEVLKQIENKIIELQELNKNNR